MITGYQLKKIQPVSHKHLTASPHSVHPSAAICKQVIMRLLIQFLMLLLRWHWLP